MNNRKISYYFGMLFLGLCMLTVILWLGRELNILTFERPSELTTPAIALGIVGFALLRISNRSRKGGT